MKRFEWSPTVELEPGVTYIPTAVDDNGRYHQTPSLKEDIEGEIIRSTRLPASNFRPD